jgi:hypothetical protein
MLRHLSTIRWNINNILFNLSMLIDFFKQSVARSHGLYSLPPLPFKDNLACEMLSRRNYQSRHLCRCRQSQNFFKSFYSHFHRNGTARLQQQQRHREKNRRMQWFQHRRHHQYSRCRKRKLPQQAQNLPQHRQARRPRRPRRPRRHRHRHRRDNRQPQFRHPSFMFARSGKPNLHHIN